MTLKEATVMGVAMFGGRVYDVSWPYYGGKSILQLSNRDLKSDQWKYPIVNMRKGLAWLQQGGRLKTYKGPIIADNDDLMFVDELLRPVTLLPKEEEWN